MCTHSRVLCSLSRFVECPICMEIFKNPMMLHCGHTYCGGCVNKLISTSAKRIQPCVRINFAGIDIQVSSILMCPACRQLTPVPRSGLLVNYALSDLVNRIAESGLPFATPTPKKTPLPQGKRSTVQISSARITPLATSRPVPVPMPTAAPIRPPAHSRLPPGRIPERPRQRGSGPTNTTNTSAAPTTAAPTRVLHSGAVAVAAPPRAHRTTNSSNPPGGAAAPPRRFIF